MCTVPDVDLTPVSGFPSRSFCHDRVRSPSADTTQPQHSVSCWFWSKTYIMAQRSFVLASGSEMRRLVSGACCWGPATGTCWGRVKKLVENRGCTVRVEAALC